VFKTLEEKKSVANELQRLPVSKTFYEGRFTKKQARLFCIRQIAHDFQSIASNNNNIRRVPGGGGGGVREGGFFLARSLRGFPGPFLCA